MLIKPFSIACWLWPTPGVSIFQGNLQKAISAAFPEQFLDLQEQIARREQEEADGEVPKWAMKTLVGWVI